MPLSMMGGRAHLDRSVGNVGGILFASQRDLMSWSSEPYDAEGALTVMPAVLTTMRRRCLPGLLVGAYVKQSGVIYLDEAHGGPMASFGF